MKRSLLPVFAWIVPLLLLSGPGLAQIRPLPRSQRKPPSRSVAPFMQRIKSFEETQYVSKIVLKNGMTVLVNEYHVQPVVSILARVSGGVASEPADFPGISRLLTRMLNKSTTTRTSDVIQQDIQSMGGIVRASTGYDSMLLEMVVPSMQWKQALDLQADELLHPLFDPGEVKRETELTVSELKGLQDFPDRYARDELIGLGFPDQHTRFDPDGSALAAVTREKLLSYYKTCVAPSRVILVIAGDVSSSEVLNDAVTQYDKPWIGGGAAAAARPESNQSAFRYAEERGGVRVPRVVFGFNTPSIGSQDFPAVEVLRAILGMGNSSVLASSLRDGKKIVLNASSGFDPDLGYLTVEMEAEAKDIDKCEIAALTEIELLKRNHPGTAEMERAAAQLEREHWNRLLGVGGRSRMLSLYESLGDWKGMNRYVARIRQVKPEDVSRAAEKYLKLERCSLLEWLPESEPSRNLNAETAFRTFRELIGPSTEQEAAEEERQTVLALNIPPTVDNFKFNELYSQFRTASILRGPDLFIKEEHTAPLIQIGFYYPGGKLTETKANSGITMLMLRWMLRGTQERGPGQYMHQLELYGGYIEPVVTDDYYGFNLSILSRNVDGGLALLGETIKTPKFDPDELGHEKSRQLADIRMRAESMTEYPSLLFDQALFPDYAYSLSAAGTEESLAGITPQAIQAWYQSGIKNKKPIVVIIGDTQGTTLAEYFVKSFSGSRFQEIKLPEALPKPPAQKSLIEQNWDKNESVVVFGFQAPPEGDEDSFTVSVLRSYLAGSGGKLRLDLCDKQGIAIRLGMSYRRRVRGGDLMIYAASSPGNEDSVVKTVQSTISDMFKGPITYRDYRAAINSAASRYWIDKQDRFWEIGSIVEGILAGQSLDDFQSFPSNIKDVKQDDFQDVGNRILKLDKAVTVLLHGRKPGAI